MKNLFAYFALCLTVVFGLAVSSCSTPLCKDVDCGTHGTCDEADGKCSCVTGYELNKAGKCDSVSRDKFVAKYNMTELCGGTSFLYELEIATSTTGIDKVILSPYGNYSAGTEKLEAIGTVVGNTITIAEQSKTLTNGDVMKIYATTYTIDAAQKITCSSYKVDLNGTLDSDCGNTGVKK